MMFTPGQIKQVHTLVIREVQKLADMEPLDPGFEGQSIKVQALLSVLYAINPSPM